MENKKLNYNELVDKFNLKRDDDTLHELIKNIDKSISYRMRFKKVSEDSINDIESLFKEKLLRELNKNNDLKYSTIPNLIKFSIGEYFKTMNIPKRKHLNDVDISLNYESEKIPEHIHKDEKDHFSHITIKESLKRIVDDLDYKVLCLILKGNNVREVALQLDMNHNSLNTRIRRLRKNENLIQLLRG